jgi:hypothetical protein
MLPFPRQALGVQFWVPIPAAAAGQTDPRQLAGAASIVSRGKGEVNNGCPDKYYILIPPTAPSPAAARQVSSSSPKSILTPNKAGQLAIRGYILMYALGGLMQVFSAAAAAVQWN